MDYNWLNSSAGTSIQHLPIFINDLEVNMQQVKNNLQISQRFVEQEIVRAGQSYRAEQSG